MQLSEFLQTVITTPEGYFCLAEARIAPDNGHVNWKEHWYTWPSELNEIVYKVNQIRDSANVYFSAHLFKEKNSSKRNVLPTRTIQADLDNADVYSLAYQPNFIIQTSASRFQAFWLLRDDVPIDLLEAASRRLTYSIRDCDRTGWTLGHRLRLPFTYNFKYNEPWHITIQQVGSKRLSLDSFDALPELDSEQVKLDEEDRAWIEQPHVDLNIPPFGLVQELRAEGKLSISTVNRYRNRTSDRSAALWQLMCECLSAGIGRDLTYWVAYNSVNNKFADNRYNKTRDLRKDVLRAEQKTHNQQLDIKEAIQTLRKSRTDGSIHERLSKIFELVLRNLRSQGTFYFTLDGVPYYVPKQTGRPVYISRMSEWWQALLTREYGINASTNDFSHVTTDIASYVRSMPQDTEHAALSHYDAANRTLLLHGGGRDVYVITPTSVSVTSNGDNSVLFRHTHRGELFKVDNSQLPSKWYDLMFDKGLETLVNLNVPQAKALLVSWFLLILMKNACHTRPLLAAFGPPGSGKSTLMRSMYRIVYGRMRGLSQLTAAPDFDLTTSAMPFVCFDNADTWERWVPDRLALATTVSETDKRKLFTDTDMLHIRRNSLVALTAHSPKFIREDVADRLVIINLSRRDFFSDDEDILGVLTETRNAIWGDIVRDIQKILLTPYPKGEDAPQFRIKDFSTFGLWVTRALGMDSDFKDAVRLIQRSQQDIVIEEELVLVSALDKLIRSQEKPAQWHMTVLWERLLELTPDRSLFIKTYKSPIFLGKKLIVMQEALKAHFSVKWSVDPSRGTRTWIFARKEN